MYFCSFRFLCFLILLKVIRASTNKYGVLAAESELELANFCIIYFKEFASLPEEKSEAESYIIADSTSDDWCENPVFESENKILLLIRNNCSVSEQASNVQNQGGKGILFIASPEETEVPINASLAKHINISVGLISKNSFKILDEMIENKTVHGRMFSPANLNFDYSLLVIWIVAVFCVAVGSYWSGIIRLEMYIQENSHLPATNDNPVSTTQVNSSSSHNVEMSSLSVSPSNVVFFVTCMGVMLLVLYFIFDYFVYVIIGLFILASAISVYGCLEPLTLRIPLHCCLFSDVRLCKGSFIVGDVDFRLFCLAVFSFALSLTWFFLRKHEYAWILQDILGVAFCIHMLKSIRLASLKICTILLVLLFFYDIFFVFVTPFLTPKGESIMEEVATGGNSKETLPMVLTVQHFKFTALAVCFKQYSILGFGDILVPGLFISYCHGFDLITLKKRLYFPITVVAYGIGLLVTFVALFLMNTAQPALLYLVPITLLPVFFVGLCRGELKLLWYGFKVNKVFEGREPTSTLQPPIASQGDEPVASEAPPPALKTRGEKEQLLH